MKILLAAAIILLSLCACALKPVEPVLRLDLFAYDSEKSRDTGRCQFTNITGKLISEKDDAIHNLVCVPSEDMDKIDEKSTRCERWKP